VAVLFGRHIVGRAYAGAREVHFFVQHLRDSEIAELDAVVGDEDVGSFEVAVQDAFVVHVEDGEGDLRGPVDHLRLFQFPAALQFLLLYDELVEVSAGAELHDDVEFLAFDDGLAVGDDVGVLEGLQEFDLIEDVLGLLCVFVGQLHFLYHVALSLGQLRSQVGVAERAESHN